MGESALDLGPLGLGARNEPLIRELLARHAPGAEVWAFGSRVNGTAHPGSDLDLVLRDPGDLTRPQTGLGALREALSESNVTLLVDLLDWARIPEAFRREIENHHRVFALPKSP